MAEDFYKTLGLDRNASAADIQTAYRKLARQYHPDMNLDDAGAKSKFQEVQRAYEVLNDPKKRDLYDRYGSSYEGFGQGGPGPGQGPGGGSWNFRSGPGGFEEVDLSEIFGGGGAAGGGFADFFQQFTGGAGPRQRHRPAARRGADLTHSVEIPFATAVQGGEVQLNLRRAQGKQETISVKIPPGIEDGKKIRVRGQGEPSPTGGTPGDILITVHVAAHPFFRRLGRNLEVTVPVSLGEAALGGKIDVPTPHGVITLTLPPGTSSGKRLRVKGHGIQDGKAAAGDLFAEILIALPGKLDDESRQLAEQFEQRNPLNPRSELRW